MQVQEFKGKNINEAVYKATKAFNCSVDLLNIVVLQKENKGFLGFGSKEAIVRASLKQEESDVAVVQETAQIQINQSDKVDINEEKQADKKEYKSPEEIGVAYLAPIFKALDVNPVITYSETDDEIKFDLNGESVGILIGRRGETLNALQLLLSLAINRYEPVRKRIVLDCESYRLRRKEALTHLAGRMAEKAKSTGRRVSLEPMNAAERRMVHIALDKITGISVESYGEEPNRHIVIYPRKK